MENEILKINVLSIAISGFLMLVAGIILYYFRQQLTGGSLRFFLPIPPIGVAAYIFVFNMFKHYECSLPDNPASILFEMFIATIVSAGVFFIFTAILVLSIGILKDI